tara:strand:- start:11965 stop:12624 length:660 start_codon:yes stop_codon:yes gene_type:complete
MKDLKYLGAFSIPLVVVIGLHFRGVYSYLTPLYAFVVIPVLEIIFPIDETNISEEQSNFRLKNKLFDWLLYLNLPIIYALLIDALFIVKSNPLETYELIGLILSVGIMLGVNGINVAHELGHRQTTNERFLGKALLLPSLYMHFYIEHNFGHHLHAATKEDPATARYNQTVYGFWFTSVFGQYVNAWKIQKKLLINNQLLFYPLKTICFGIPYFKPLIC